MHFIDWFIFFALMTCIFIYIVSLIFIHLSNAWHFDNNSVFQTKEIMFVGRNIVEIKFLFCSISHNLIIWMINSNRIYDDTEYTLIKSRSRDISIIVRSEKIECAWFICSRLFFINYLLIYLTEIPIRYIGCVYKWRKSFENKRFQLASRCTKTFQTNQNLTQ